MSMLKRLAELNLIKMSRSGILFFYIKFDN
jgi:hypothetical protein